MSEIKNLPDGWVESTLGAVCDNVSRRFDFKKKSNVIFVNTGDVLNGKFLHSEYISKIGLPGQAKKAIKKGDILFSEIRPKNKRFAKVNFDAEDYVVSTKFMVIEHNELVDLEYLYILLTSVKQVDEFNQIAESRSGTFPQITFDAISYIKVYLPTIQEQKSIASILTAFDDKIELLQAQNKTLEETAQTIFTEWFEKNSEKNEITRLGDIITIRGGYSYKGNELGKGRSFLLGMGCVSNNNRFLSKGARLYSDNFPQTYLIEPGEIVLATRQQSENLPILGYPAIVPNDYKGKRVLVGTNLYMVKNNSLLNNEIIFLLFKSEAYRNHILNNSKGTTVKMITKDSIENFKFKMPSKYEINKCQDLILPLIEKLKINEEQIQTLTKTRDELLPRLMSGEVRVQ